MLGFLWSFLKNTEFELLFGWKFLSKIFRKSSSLSLMKHPYKMDHTGTSSSIFFQISVLPVSKSQNMLSKVYIFTYFYTWMNQQYIRLRNWLWKNATRGRFKLKTTENRTKTVISSLSRRVQRQYGCQNFRNLSQNSNLLVWCSTIQSRRT